MRIEPTAACAILLRSDGARASLSLTAPAERTGLAHFRCPLWASDSASHGRKGSWAPSWADVRQAFAVS